MTTNEPSLQQPPFQETPLGTAEPIEATPTPLEIDPDNPPWAANAVWGLVKAVLLWITSVACLVIVPLLVVLPYLIYRYSTVPLRTDEMSTDKVFLFLSVLGVIPAHLLTLFIIWAVVTESGRYPFWKTVGLTWSPNTRPVTTIALSGLLAVLLLAIGGVVTSWFGGEKTQIDQLINSSLAARLTTVFLAFATAPLVEELIYRGVLYPAIARIVGAGVGVALVSIMFAGVHYWQYQNNLAVVGVITLLSIVLTLVRAYTGRLMPSFIIHLIFNGLQSLYLIVQPLIEKSEQTVPNAAPGIRLLAQTLHHLN